jgi:hypothetical protein
MFTFRELFCEGITVHSTGFLLPISSAESQDIADICGSTNKMASENARFLLPMRKALSATSIRIIP